MVDFVRSYQSCSGIYQADYKSGSGIYQAGLPGIPMRLPDGVDSIRAFGRRVGRSHPTILQAIDDGRITSTYHEPAGDRLRGVYWQAALVEYQRNTDPTQAQRSGAAPLNTGGPNTGGPNTGGLNTGGLNTGGLNTGGLNTGGLNIASMRARPVGYPLSSSSTHASTPMRENLPAASLLGDAGQGNALPSPGFAVSPPAAAEGELPFGELQFEDAPPAAPAKSGKDDPHGYLEHRARTEEFRSKQAELEYLRDLGLVVSAVEAREANFSRYRMLRDKLLNIPDRVATILAAEREAGRVHQQLTAELKRVLSELSNDATAEAAGGAAERVAA